MANNSDLNAMTFTEGEKTLLRMADPLVLQDELGRMKNSLEKLKESNEYLRGEDTSDPDIAEAIAENELVIAKRTFFVQKIEERLAELQPHASETKDGNGSEGNGRPHFRFPPLDR